jgi:uncharacterized protein (TIGR02246 family)
MSSTETSELSALDAALRLVEDRIAIRELVARYNRAIDDAHAEDFAHCFVEDGCFRVGTGGPVVAGWERLAAMSRAAGIRRVHMTTDPVISVDGDTATHVCTALIGNRQADRAPGSTKWTSTGRYHDDLVRTADGWRFVQRVWVEDAYIADRVSNY